MKYKIRESNFELLRIVAMLCIVYYHFLLYSVIPVKGVDSFFGAIQIPLHIGVPLFILISGYFGIKPSVSGAMKLILMTLIYYVPLQIAFDYHMGAGTKCLLRDILFISHGPYWFIRIYFLFYLFVPIVNAFLANAESKKRWYAICVLAVINFWFGAISKGDASLSDGKNLINFTFIYVIGNTLKYYQNFFDKIDIRKFVTAFVLLNVFVVGIYYFPHNDILRKIVTRIAFGYNSPVLIINAVLLFVIFIRLKIKSMFVNKMSASVLAVYLITEHTVVREYILEMLAKRLLSICSSTMEIVCGLMSMTILVVMCCIFFDMAFSRVLQMLPEIKLQKLIKKIMVKNIEV